MAQIPTIKVKRKSDGEMVIINQDAFDEKLHDKFAPEQKKVTPAAPVKKVTKSQDTEDGDDKSATKKGVAGTK